VKVRQVRHKRSPIGTRLAKPTNGRGLYSHHVYEKLGRSLAEELHIQSDDSKTVAAHKFICHLDYLFEKRIQDENERLLVQLFYNIGDEIPAEIAKQDLGKRVKAFKEHPRYSHWPYNNDSSFYGHFNAILEEFEELIRDDPLTEGQLADRMERKFRVLFDGPKDLHTKVAESASDNRDAFARKDRRKDQALQSLGAQIVADCQNVDARVTAAGSASGVGNEPHGATQSTSKKNTLEGEVVCSNTPVYSGRFTDDNGNVPPTLNRFYQRVDRWMKEGVRVINLVFTAGHDIEFAIFLMMAFVFYTGKGVQNPLFMRGDAFRCDMTGALSARGLVDSKASWDDIEREFIIYVSSPKKAPDCVIIVGLGNLDFLMNIIPLEVNSTFIIISPGEMYDQRTRNLDIEQLKKEEFRMEGINYCSNIRGLEFNVLEGTRYTTYFGKFEDLRNSAANYSQSTQSAPT
jgi:hypothetical protein